MLKGIPVVLLILPLVQINAAKIIIEANQSHRFNYYAHDGDRHALIQLDTLQEKISIFIESDNMSYKDSVSIVNKLTPAKLEKLSNHHTAESACSGHSTLVDRTIADLTHALEQGANAEVIAPLRSAVIEAFMLWLTCILR